MPTNSGDYSVTYPASSATNAQFNLVVTDDGGALAANTPSITIDDNGAGGEYDDGNGDTGTGTVAIPASGGFTCGYTPPLDFTGDVQFGFSNNKGVSDPGGFTVTITAPASGPAKGDRSPTASAGPRRFRQVNNVLPRQMR